MMTKYEYCLVYYDKEIERVKAIDNTGIIATAKSHLDIFNKLGKMGWRLTLQVPHLSPNGIESPHNFFYLEREIE